MRHVTRTKLSSVLNSIEYGSSTTLMTLRNWRRMVPQSQEASDASAGTKEMKTIDRDRKLLTNIDNMKKRGNTYLEELYV